MSYGFYRVACVSPELRVCDCPFNAEKIIDSIRQAAAEGASVIVFPELCITGYTCGDLFLQTGLQKSAIAALEGIAKKTSSYSSLILVGLPLAVDNALYNCAAVIKDGKVLAVIPKSFIPNYGEFYERRYFAPASECSKKEIFLSEKNPCVPFGTDILIEDSNNSGFVLGVELCEDLWVPLPPSTGAALAGATLIANLSGSNEIIGKADYRRSLVKMHSANTVSVYMYANAGHDESTQDVVYSGHSIIAENGSILSQSELFFNGIIYADVDVERILQERRRMVTYSQCSAENVGIYRKIPVDIKEKTLRPDSLRRYIDPHPFVPSSKSERSERCSAVVQLQAEGLAKRLRHIHCQSAVIGLSGGLDSTLALLVTCRAFDLCGIPRSCITAVTMPCFGTTDRTYNNACMLAKTSGVSLREIHIAESVRRHFADIGQDESVHDVTYENCQARERTQVLMDLANKTNGIVIGTGDLSELALGWCTYNGDQMSMYGVNSSVPKTLVRHLVAWFADEADSSLADVLRDILDTPVSPELLPPENGKIVQKTEDLVGPYELHDFFLYYLLRFGFNPEKILFLADAADLPFDHNFKLKWLRTFYRRFFMQQFKRSCMPDGAKVGTVNLSPRGDWRMPSDASATVWLEEIDRLK
ncbi:MAG: NAD(+) synthase [Treponema sp.]|nr:NAD(+) synthase [Treponema sp.]